MGEIDDKGIAIDFAVILHSFSAQFNNILEWIEPAANYLGYDFTGGAEPTQSKLEEALLQPAKLLREELTQYLRSFGSKKFGAKKEAASDPDFIGVLETTKEILTEYIWANTRKRVRAPFLSQQIEQLSRACYVNDGGATLKPGCDGIVESIRAFQKVICAYDLSVAMFTVRELKQQANALHSFYTYDITTKESVRLVDIYELIQSVIQENAPYAASKQIELRLSGLMNYKVKARKRDLIRAISQVVRNAIKYNYMSEKFDVWVDINCYRAQQGIGIDVGNWGYPITADELASESIYQVGKRGTFAARSGEPGFGIGLADARRVIAEHGGSIRIKSVPARKGGDPNNYNQPFLTTVTIELPDATA